MNKTLLASSMALALTAIAPSANAAFTAMGAGNYTLSITGGCFEFGNCQTTGNGGFTATTAGEAQFSTLASTNTTRAVGSQIGSGIGGSSTDFGEIKFTLDGSGNITNVASYRQTSYLGTAGGTFYVDALGTAGTSLMNGSVDNTAGPTEGTFSFQPKGREGMAQSFQTGLGTQDWNDSIKKGDWDTLTTGSTTNALKGGVQFTTTGTALTDTGTAGEWSGVIATAGNINGTKWIGFTNVLYSEVYNVTISLDAPAAVPVPAAAWLFGSGLLGLVGVARRRKSS